MAKSSHKGPSKRNEFRGVPEPTEEARIKNIREAPSTENGLKELGVTEQAKKVEEATKWLKEQWIALFRKQFGDIFGLSHLERLMLEGRTSVEPLSHYRVGGSLRPYINGKEYFSDAIANIGKKPNSEEMMKGYASLVKSAYEKVLDEQRQQVKLPQTECTSAQERIKELNQESYQTQNNISIVSYGEISPDYAGEVKPVDNQLRVLDGGVEAKIKNKPILDEDDPAFSKLFSPIGSLKDTGETRSGEDEPTGQDTWRAVTERIVEFEDIKGASSRDVTVKSSAVVVDKKNNQQLVYEYSADQKILFPNRATTKAVFATKLDSYDSSKIPPWEVGERE